MCKDGICPKLSGIALCYGSFLVLGMGPLDPAFPIQSLLREVSKEPEFCNSNHNAPIPVLTDTPVGVRTFLNFTQH